MINKSPAYEAAINANTRMTDFAAQFGFVPPGAVEGATLSSTSRASYAQLAQVKDGNSQMGAYWRNLNDWPLDGSTTLIDGTGQLGFWSSYLSNNNSTMANSTYVTYTLDTTYDLIGVTVYFDIPGNEYATDFTVGYYNSSNTLLTSKTVSGNRSPQVVVELAQTGVNSIRVTVSNWCLPNARPRIAEIIPGQFYTFDLSNSFALQMGEVIKPFSNSFETSELSIEFDNSDHKFDFLNPDGVFSYLRQQMKIESQIGLNIGGIYDQTNSGTRYLYEIPNDEQVQSASLVCRPAVAFASADAGNNLGTNTIATAAATLWGKTSFTETITIDASLQSIACNKYIGENVDIKDALAALALTAGGYWFIDRDGNMELRPITTSLTSPVYTMSYDEMFSKPKITQNAKVTAVRIGYSYLDFGIDWKSKQTIYTNGANDGAQVEAISYFTPSTTRAEEIGQLVLDYHAARRLTFDISYRGNPALEVGDIIEVETDYGYRNIEITEHTLILDGNGFLRGSIKGVG